METRGFQAGDLGMDFSTYFTGMTMGLSLIVAIGAQNAFILRQGLRHEYVFAVCLACALSDAVLIALVGIACSLLTIVLLLHPRSPLRVAAGAA